jgi:SAM-dependent methyltransferase|tara:strand:+ start:456 stop:1106 length:651 start_codon:yes stop_codon:yes gene_type:complete
MFNQYPVNKNLNKYEVEMPEFWNNIYNSGSPAWGSTPATILDKFITYFTGYNVLDIGCGEGRNSIYLEQLKYSVTGVDISQSAIDLANKKESSCNFYCKDLINDTWINKKFDVIIDFGLFHFVPYEYRSLYVSNIWNSLSNGGIYCNQSGRLVKESPIISNLYVPPQLESKEILDAFSKFKFELLEDDVLPPQNGYGKYPCWNFVVKKIEENYNVG